MPGRQVADGWPEILLFVTSGNITVADEDLPDDGRFLAKPYGEQEMVDRVANIVEEGHESRS